MENRNIVFEENIIKESHLLVQFSSLYYYLHKRIYYIIIAAVLGGSLGLLLSYYKKPQYSATTSFVLEDSKNANGLGSLAGLASIAGLDIGGAPGGIFQGDNILELYKSRNMIKQALLSSVTVDGKTKRLIDIYISFNNFSPNITAKEFYKNSDMKSDEATHKSSFEVLPSRFQDSIINEIVKDINSNYLKVIKPDKKLSIINAEVSSTNEVFAKLFNEKIVSTVNNFYIQTRTKKSLESVSLLQRKTDSVRKIMNLAIVSGANATDATPNLNPTRQTQRIVPVQQSQFNIQANQAILSELIKNLELSKINLQKETPLIQIIDNPVYPLSVNTPNKFKFSLIGILLGIFLVSVFFTLKFLLSYLVNRSKV